jgi:UDP-N-acetylmuramate dehydrogenase
MARQPSNGGKGKKPAAAPKKIAAKAPVRPAAAKTTPGRGAESKPAAPAKAGGGSRAQARVARTDLGASFPLDRVPGALREHEPLVRYTTFRIGGPARFLFVPAGADAVAGAIAWATAQRLPWLVLGLGSNVLVRDGGFPGLVIRLGKGLDDLSHRAGIWKIGAGVPIPVLARQSAEEGFAGIHRLIGVPGTVGGGVYLNAGAHGNDFASVLVSATVLDPSGRVAELPRAKIPFTYRASGLGERVVLGCVLKLEKAEPRRLQAETADLMRRRKAGTPYDQPCCGMVFRNPVESTAGRLIDQCGLKGRRVGGAEISRVHANYIINKGNASADDVLKLIDIARTAVFKDFGIELQLEVKILGEAK